MSQNNKTSVVNCRDECYDVFIGRPSIWGNPFRVGIHGTREQVIEKYRKYILDHPYLLDLAQEQLKGKVLGCYCRPLACHGDVLCELLNEENKEERSE